MPLTQTVGNWEEAKTAAPLRPFDDRILNFFNDLSKKLTTVREFSDVATFGFWCRKASLLHEKSKYDDIDSRLGRGVIFHSTPSNVAVNFAFSFAAGLLAGNANIVRLPAKDFEQVNIICDAIKELLKSEHAALSPYVSMLKYPSERGLHDLFSSFADVRIVWGGDVTIANMRKSPLKPRATEVTFADRHSIAVIDADAYLKAESKERIAQDFYNDTYFSDQNACTSPRMVFWIGENKEAAKAIFWEQARALAEEKYEFAPVQAVGKLNAFYLCAAEHDVELSRTDDNYVSVVDVNKMDSKLTKFMYNSGFFLEYDIEELSEILPVSDERCQTLTYYGLSKEQIGEFFENGRPKGVDRVVPMGKSMDFTLVWDGYDLIRQLSRKITVL
jgi:hypothetical protein